MKNTPSVGPLDRQMVTMRHDWEAFQNPQANLTLDDLEGVIPKS